MGSTAIGDGIIEPFREIAPSFIRGAVINPDAIVSQTTRITNLIKEAARVQVNHADTKAIMYHIVKIMWIYAPDLFQLFLTQVLNVAIPSDVILVANIADADDIDELPYSFVLFICNVI